MSRTPPQALGCPVRENEVAPGRQICPHAADTLVDAHAPQGHGRGGFREQAPGFPYLLLGDVAELGYLVRRIVLKERPVVVKGGILAVIGLEYCVLVVETRIVQFFVQNDPSAKEINVSQDVFDALQNNLDEMSRPR